MDASFKEQVEAFVEIEVSRFHQRRASKIESLKLSELLSTKNPYLFRAKNLESASELVNALLDARLSSAEEAMFGEFMESLAVFISEVKCNGRKSGITGIDIELMRDGVRYLIAVKSGKAWGNSSQHKDLKANFATAVKVLRQNKTVGHIQPTLGICYGKFRRTDNGLFVTIGGRDFWQLISGEEDLYMTIIEPIGYRAKEFNDEFGEKRSHASNRMVREFTGAYCLADGRIDWQKIVTLVSKNAEPTIKGPKTARVPRKRS